MIERIFGPTAEGKNPHSGHWPKWTHDRSAYKAHRTGAILLIFAFSLFVVLLLIDIWWIDWPVAAISVSAFGIGAIRISRTGKLYERRLHIWLRDHDCPAEIPGGGTVSEAGR